MNHSPAPVSPAVRIHTLGRLEVETPAGALGILLRQPKRFALLTYLTLASRGGYCRRDTILAVFWPESDPRRARGALRNALYFLRKVLGPEVFHTEGDDAIRVDPAIVWCDAAAFEDAIAARCPAEAMRWYRGDFLEGFHLNDGAQFDEWHGAIQRRLRRQATAASLQLATSAERASDLATAEAWATRAVEFAPLDDEAARRLITVLRVRGKTSAAAETFDLFRARLEDIDLVPAPEMARLVTGSNPQPPRVLAKRAPSRSAGTVSHPVPVTPNRRGGPNAPWRRWRRRWTRVGTLGAIGMVAAVAALTPRWTERRWARSEGFQTLRELVDHQDYVGAFRMARRLAPSLAGDAEFDALWVEATLPTTVRTTPDSAKVYIKDYTRPNDDWILLGTTPLDNIQVPATYLRWRVERTGFESIERAALDAYLRPEMHFDLPPRGSRPDMIRVSGDAVNLAAPRAMPLEAYWLDRYEVTNGDYARFVDGGGYEHPEWWPSAFVFGDGSVDFPRGIGHLIDRSGHPGPAEWTGGRFPAGDDDLPVRGVSWYEAAAYCRWAGKELPTLYHWYGAGGYHGYSSIIPLSNYAADGPAPVGAFSGIGPYGHYDLAGNVREWVSNAAGPLRYVLGGAWDSPRYLFWEPDAAPPWNRSSRNGFRCAVMDEPTTHASRQALRLSSRPTARDPVHDAVFGTYRALYAYDATPLRSVVDSVADEMPHWRREFVSFDAAYGGETVQAHLFLPKHAVPPYSAVVVYPGAEANTLSSSAQLRTSWFDFAVRHGRAVMYPVYKGTYERRVPLAGPKQMRDQFIQRAKDLQRSVDYLETRSDIDGDRIAYYGFSEGGTFAPIFATIENRFVASVVLSGGLIRRRVDPMVEPANFLPRAHHPLLMIGGELDFIFPAATSQRPFFEAWAADASHKRFVTLTAGHAPTDLRAVASEVLGWLDRYLGPVNVSGERRSGAATTLPRQGRTARVAARPE